MRAARSVIFAPFLTAALFIVLAVPVSAGPECDAGSREGSGCSCVCFGGPAPAGSSDGDVVEVGGVRGVVSGGRFTYLRDATCNGSSQCEQECDRLLRDAGLGSEVSGTDSSCTPAGGGGALPGSIETMPPGGLEPSPAGTPPGTPPPATYEQGKVVTELVNPLGTTSIPALIGRIISAFLAISGSIALLMVIYGGFTWLTSGGSPDKIEKGKKILVWSVIGLVIIFGAYSLVNFVLSKVIGV